MSTTTCIHGKKKKSLYGYIATYESGYPHIVFDLITAHTPINSQSSSSIVFRLQPVYILSTFYKDIIYVVGTHLNESTC